MKLKIFIVLLLFFNVTATAQFYSVKQDEGFVGGGFGVTWIDGQPFYSLHLFPEVAFSNFGVGLDLKLEYGANGKIRTENFNEFSDYLSIIRFVRYGYKGDPLYARLGALDYATLGHGSIMYLYNNSPSYDARKVGLAFDIDFNNFGIESVYGNFGQAGVIGLRGYVKPFQFTAAGTIPVLGNLEAGVSLVTDLNDKSGIIAGNYDAVKDEFTSTVDKGSITALGMDLGLPLVRSSLLDLDYYFDYVKIIDFGSGAATGLFLNFKGLGLVNLKAKLERRFNGDRYLPSYFNSFYEIERFQLNKNTGTLQTKAQRLNAAVDIGNGYYGELLVDVLGIFKVLGSYQRLDKQPNSGILHLSTNVAPEGFPYVARAGYDKVNIKDEADLFKLDDRSYFFFEFGYKPYPYLLVSMVYQWTFEPIRDGGDNIIDYKAQKKIEPRISFIYPFDVGR